MDNKINGSDIFFSTIYKWVFYIVSTLIITPNIIISTRVSHNTAYWIIIATTIEYTLGMIILYIISKRIRIKHNNLSIKAIPLHKKALYSLICLTICFISTILSSFIEILIILCKIKN